MDGRSVSPCAELGKAQGLSWPKGLAFISKSGTLLRNTPGEQTGFLGESWFVNTARKAHMTRKPTHPLIIGVIACLAIAALAYFWVNAKMDSLYAYRSPLAEKPPAPIAPANPALTGRVVFVLVDALRVDTALKPEMMPFLAELRAQGAWATMHSRPPSYSAPSYSVLFTGAWPDLSDGPAMNLAYAEIPTWTQDNLFSAAQRAGLKTAVSGYYWFEKLIPQKALSAGFYTPGEDAAADQAVMAAALPWLAEGGYQLVLIHLDQVDYAGHYEGGPRDPRWDAAARRVDDHLREIAAGLDFSQDTLLVASDHGQIDAGGHGGHEAVVLVQPFVLAGAGVTPGRYPDVQQVDVAPTLAALLGAGIPASAQGRVLTEMLALPPDASAALRAAEQGQKRTLAEAYGAAIGRPVAWVDGGEPAATAANAITAARAARLNTERLPRALLALALLVIFAFGLWRGRGRDLGWMLLAALVYVALFNLRYAVVDGRTYSLSSVTSADDIILYSAATAALALAFAWLLLVVALRLARRTRLDAAWATLRWTLLTLAVAGLPALLSFVFNGPVVTWMLPDFGSFFLGFLAVLQLLFIALCGLALSGLAAGLARIPVRRAASG